MTETITDEKVAYISPGGSDWRVEIRDGTGLSDGVFTKTRRYYHDTIEDACEQAERFSRSE